MGGSTARRAKRNRRAKARQLAAKTSMQNTPTRLPKAVVPTKAHLEALKDAYKDFHLAGKALERQQDKVHRQSADASTLLPIAADYNNKTNLMIVGCLQQSLVRHKSTGKQYNFFGNMVAAIKEHAESQRWGTPFRQDFKLKLKPPRHVQKGRQVAHKPERNISAGARGAALLQQFNAPLNQFQHRWTSK